MIFTIKKKKKVCILGFGHLICSKIGVLAHEEDLSLTSRAVRFHPYFHKSHHSYMSGKTKYSLGLYQYNNTC